MEQLWSGLEALVQDLEKEIAELRGRLGPLEELRDSAKQTIQTGRAYQQRLQPVAEPAPETQAPSVAAASAPDAEVEQAAPEAESAPEQPAAEGEAAPEASNEQPDEQEEATPEPSNEQPEEQAAPESADGQTADDHAEANEGQAPVSAEQSSDGAGNGQSGDAEDSGGNPADTREAQLRDVIPGLAEALEQVQQIKASLGDGGQPSGFPGREEAKPE